MFKGDSIIKIFKESFFCLIIFVGILSYATAYNAQESGVAGSYEVEFGKGGNFQNNQITTEIDQMKTKLTVEAARDGGSFYLKLPCDSEQAGGPVDKVIVVSSRFPLTSQNTTKVFATHFTTGDIYELHSSSLPWTKVGGPGAMFVGAQGYLYGLSPDGGAVMGYDEIAGSWVRVGGAASKIFGGMGGLYATNPDTGDLYRYEGFSRDQLTTPKWTKVGGPGKTFAVGGFGRLYGISTSGQGVYSFDGQPMKWTQIGGPAAEIYAGGDELYATNPQTGDINRYMGTPFSWTKMGDPGKMFAVDDSGRLYGLSSDSKKIILYKGPMKWIGIGGPAEFRAIFAGGEDIYATIYATDPKTNNLIHLLCSGQVIKTDCYEDPSNGHITCPPS